MARTEVSFGEATAVIMRQSVHEPESKAGGQSGGEKK